LLDRVAAKYGGTVNEWTPDGGAAQFEVITETTRMPIHVPPQPVSQYFELWSGGGCQRRCDGVTELLKDRPCICGPDPEQRSCKPTTRLNVVLSEIEGVGVWRLESHGYYAASNSRASRSCWRRPAATSRRSSGWSSAPRSGTGRPGTGWSRRSTWR